MSSRFDGQVGRAFAPGMEDRGF